jgi:hypothetical protein
MEGAWALLLLLLLRVGPLALWTPLGGGATSPAWARGAVAVALAGALWPLAWGAGAPPGEALWALALKEAMLGGALAFLVARVFWAAQGAQRAGVRGAVGPGGGGVAVAAVAERGGVSGQRRAPRGGGGVGAESGGLSAAASVCI